jgi:restriction system protein
MAFPPENINANISPREFELFIKDHISNLGQDLKTFKAEHDTVLVSHDGEYQIDIYAEFDLLGVTFKVLVECKRHKSKIKREVVQILSEKLHSSGANKGLIFSTSGFQTGAIKFATAHGIALIRVIEGRFTYITKSQTSRNYQQPDWGDREKYVGEYRVENSVCYLQKGCLEPLAEFLFQ